MSEMQDTSSDPESHIPMRLEFHPPFMSDGVLLGDIAARLADQGEPSNPLLFEMLDDTRLLQGLTEHCEGSATQIDDYFKHSSRYYDIDRFGKMFNRDEKVTIPIGPENVHSDGSGRREEEGRPIDLEHIRSEGIDPAYVLYFRVTQPQEDLPKPEYYWTSDLIEVKRGLTVELGGQAASAIILVSTLEEIAKPSGLINDRNDDNGIAVRQIGLQPFEQSRALFSFSRAEPKMTVTRSPYNQPPSESDEAYMQKYSTVPESEMSFERQREIVTSAVGAQLDTVFDRHADFTTRGPDGAQRVSLRVQLSASTIPAHVESRVDEHGNRTAFMWLEPKKALGTEMYRYVDGPGIKPQLDPYTFDTETGDEVLRKPASFRDADEYVAFWGKAWVENMQISPPIKPGARELKTGKPPLIHRALGRLGLR